MGRAAYRLALSDMFDGRLVHPAHGAVLLLVDVLVLYAESVLSFDSFNLSTLVTGRRFLRMINLFNFFCQWSRHTKEIIDKPIFFLSLSFLF